MADMKDLKKFPGNKALGGEFMFFPIDRTKTVQDIPKLQPNQVKVCAIINQGKKIDPKTGKRVRPLRPMICLVSDIPDEDQVEFIIHLRKEKKLELASDGAATVTGGERLVSHLINDYILSDKISKKKDAWTIQQILKFWNTELGHILLVDLKAAEITSVKKLLKDKAPKTQNNYVSALCSCFNYGVKNLHWITANVVKEVAKEEVDNKIERFLSDDERGRFLKGLERSESLDLPLDAGNLKHLDLPGKI